MAIDPKELIGKLKEPLGKAKELIEQKSKFVMIGLAGFSLICLFLFMQASGSRHSLLQENQGLKRELTTLAARLGRLDGELRDSKSKISLLNEQLEKVTQEKQDLEARYDLAGKEKQALIDKFKEQQEKVQTAPQPVVAPQTGDEYWAGVVKSKTNLELQLESIRNELRSLKNANEQMLREKAALEMEITNLNNDREEIKRQLEYAQRVTDGITQELVRERNDKMRIYKNLRSIKGENSVLIRQLKTLNNRKTELQKKVDNLQQENTKFQRRFTEMETILSDRMSQIDVLRNKLEAAADGTQAEGVEEKKPPVELPPIVVRPQPERTSARQELPDAGLSGKILAINRQNNFVIINIGQESGVNMGDNFRVFRDDKAIAGIEVIQVRREISACDIKSESMPIRVGDAIR